MHRLPVVTHPRPHAHGGHGVPVGCMLVRLVLACHQIKRTTCPWA